jgi:hypothetical protein
MAGHAGIVLHVCQNAKAMKDYSETGGRCQAGKRGRRTGEERRASPPSIT